MIKTYLARRKHTAQVFRMILNTHKPRMILQLNDLHSLPLRILANKRKTRLVQSIYEQRIDFEPMSMALGD